MMTENKFRTSETPTSPSNLFGDSNNCLQMGTIDFSGLRAEQLTESGSFDLRGFQLTSMGRLLNAVPIAALLADTSQCIVFANQYCQKLGCGTPPIVGERFCSIFPRQEDAAKMRRTAHEILSKKKLWVSENVVELGKDRMWGRLSFRRVRIGDRRFLLALIEDLTLEKRQILLIQSHKESIQKARDNFQRELQESRESFSSIVEKTTDGILILDQENIILYANSAAAKFFGRVTKHVVGQNFSVPIEAGQTAELAIARANGSEGSGEVRIEPTRWNGKPAFLVTVRDITERKRAEQELLRAQKLESLELIAGGLAHDFNNLLTGNLANISLAKIKATAASPIYDALLRAEKSAMKAKELTKQLLAFTRGHPPVTRPTSMHQLLKDSVALALSGSSIRCNLDLAEDLWPAEVEPSQITMVFQNLIINAQQAMPKGGTMKIRAENAVVANRNDHALTAQDTTYVKVSVRDEGDGISPEIFSKIFDPYFTTKPEGTGLGLATAYSITKRHSGRIEVESRLGVGSVFHVYLPATTHKVNEVKEGTEPVAICGSGRILVVDDEEDIIEACVELLRLLGYEAECAQDGMEGVERYKAALAAQVPFDAVIMDLTIPGGMGGRQAVQELLKIDSTAKVILSSGYSDDPAMVNYQRYGFKGILDKPFNAIDLGMILSQVIKADSK
jgi:two-component system cell cycle sensor histidine kinase/response regulator CckA